MTTRNQNTIIGCAAIFALMSQAAPGAVFAFRIDNAATALGSPTDDGQNFQQKWGSPENWTYVSGTDDGIAGVPDGADTFTMDRTSNAGGSTRLTPEGAPGGLISIGGITGTGTGNQDIVFKTRDFTIGDLTLLASANPFHIRAERDKSITISGVISGEGDLLMTRDSGFSDGTQPDELITITGLVPNTITGSMRLWNSNNSGTDPQPSYWVADKVGAFGQAPTVTLEGRAGANGGIASLQFTANTIGGEGAIDDDATALFIGAKGLLSIDAGVDEKIGEGNLSIDLTGSGSPITIAPGTYDNTEAWIIGDGTITVIPEPSSFALAALGLLGFMRRKR